MPQNRGQDHLSLTREAHRPPALAVAHVRQNRISTRCEDGHVLRDLGHVRSTCSDEVTASSMSFTTSVQHPSQTVERDRIRRESVPWERKLGKLLHGVLLDTAPAVPAALARLPGRVPHTASSSSNSWKNARTPVPLFLDV